MCSLNDLSVFYKVIEHNDQPTKGLKKCIELTKEVYDQKNMEYYENITLDIINKVDTLDYFIVKWNELYKK